MSYSTRYTLTVQLLIGSQVAVLVDPAPLFALVDKIRDSYEDASFVLTDRGTPNDSGVWRSWEDDLRVASESNHNILFTLHGEGEDAGDIWNAYFLNGKMQHEKATLTIAPFDPEKLT